MASPAMAADSVPFQDDEDAMVTQSDDFSNTEHLFRVAGPSRISTAIKLNNSSDKVWGDEAIIARSDDFADALSSGPLADVLDAPLYVSNPGSSIDPRVIADIQAQGISAVTIVGGTGVFTEAARQQLEDEGMTVTRQRGLDRYETAVGIARRTVNQIGLEDPSVRTRDVNVYLATGMDFPDALAAGAAAADNDGIVLLTKDKTMERFTTNFLTRQWDTLYPDEQGIEIHTVGTQAEVAAKSEFEDIADTNSGKNRYATAVMLASKFKNDVDKIAVVSGENYADGVVAGAWVANHDGPLLLTRNAFLSPETAAFLGTEDITDGDTDIVVVGGTGSVSQNVSNQIAATMTW
jgi:putative cell wall-binding protein